MRSLVWLVVAAALAAPTPGSTGLSPEMSKQLDESKYVYIQSQRKDGSFGAPAEIWFMRHDGAVWVASRPTSWRARRIRAGRPLAKVHALNASGPAFEASGAIVADPAVWQVLFDTFAKRYPDGWPRHEKAFRDGSADGSYVLIRYSPR